MTTGRIDVLAWIDGATRAVEWTTDADLPLRANAPAVRAAVAELIEEHAAMGELLRIQDEALTAYRELVEHRNRQIYALGGEP